MILLFQDYFILGSMAISAIGAAMLILDRNRLYDLASKISLVGFAFPFFFIIATFSPIRVIDFGGKFDVFAQGPQLGVMILDLLWAYPAFVGSLSRRALAFNYILLALTSLFGGIYAFPALFSFALSMLGTMLFGVIGGELYLSERTKEMRIGKILAFIASQDSVSLEDVMRFMGMTDAQADSILYEMWRRNLIEKVEGAEAIYKAIQKR